MEPRQEEGRQVFRVGGYWGKGEVEVGRGTWIGWKLVELMVVDLLWLSMLLACDLLWTSRLTRENRHEAVAVVALTLLAVLATLVIGKEVVRALTAS